MANKIKLGTRPKHFERTIKVPLHEGGEGVLPVKYVYRTRTEFGQFVDELVSAAKVAPPQEQTEEAVAFSLRASLEATRDTNAEYIMKVVAGWGLDEDFNLANVKQLCDELPGAAIAIIDQYRAAISEGRLGN